MQFIALPWATLQAIYRAKNGEVVEGKYMSVWQGTSLTFGTPLMKVQIASILRRSFRWFFAILMMVFFIFPGV